jgi:uncharacterized repeat protein (TIGR01451 family)
MRKRVLVLLGTVTLGLVALFSLMWLASSTSLVAHAGPAKIAPEISSHAVAVDPAAPGFHPEDSRLAATSRVLYDVDLVVVKDDDVGPISVLNAPLRADKRTAVTRLLRTAREQASLASTQHRDFVYEGDLITYTVAVVNEGADTATNVVLTETLPEHTDYVGVGWNPVNGRTFTQTVGTLLPGEGRTVYFVVRVHDPLPDGVDNLVNLICGGGDESDASTEDNCNYEDTPVRRWPLRVEKRTEDCISPGDAFSYTVTYRNRTTDTTFYDVTLTDTLDAYVGYAGGPSDGWGCAGRVCTQTIPTILPGVSDTLLLPAQLDALFPYTLQTSITNVVEISGGNRFVLVTPIAGPDLAVVKNDNVGPLPQRGRWEAVAGRLSALGLFRPLQTAQHREFVRPGERITYTILYLNDGFVPATGVVLTETLPEYTSYVGGDGWTPASGRQYTLHVGDLAPSQGGEVQFIVQVHEPFPLGEDRVINRVDIGGEMSECDLGNNWSADDTPVRTDVKLYIANRDSGTVDVFDTADFEHIKTLPVGTNPYGMAVHGDHLFVADFAEDASSGSLHVVDILSDTVVASIAGVGAHPIHVAADGGYVYVASHSGPPPITVVRAEPPWDIVTELYLNRDLTYEFGLFGATVDVKRDRIYFSKPDFGSEGIWALTPSSPTWQLDYVYPSDEAPRSILYHPTTGRVYAAFGYIDEVWAFDPSDWTLLERIPTDHQDATHPGYGAHGLAALGQCIFVSNYISESVTAVVDGSCVEGLGTGLVAPPAGPHRIYLPIVGRDLVSERRIVTIPLSGRPEGMTGAGNLLFVTLSNEDRVAVINTETLTVVGQITVTGSCPHTAILAGDIWLSSAP